jgi:cytochrome c
MAAALAGAVALAVAAPGAATANPCNPCAPKSRNPCAAKNPCAAAAAVDPKLITRPKGTKLYTGNPAELRKEGERLWNDTKLSTNGMSCNTCHQNNGAFNASFAQPYPHKVAMVQEKAGLKTIRMDEMVQICMVVPMAAKPLPWDSRELAALTAYTAQVQKDFQRAAKNPCAAK